jgi:hypothetical protein
VTLPLGTAGELPNIEQTKNFDLENAIKKSSAEINAAQNAEPKRPRGRPRKIKPEAATPSMDSAAPGIPSMEATAQMDITPLFSQIIKMPFEIAATKTKCELIKLDESEAKDPAALANQLFQAYAPDLLGDQDPKRLMLVSFGLSVGMLALTKARIYADWKTDHTVITKTTESGSTETTVATESTAPPATNFVPTPAQAPPMPFARAAQMMV